MPSTYGRSDIPLANQSADVLGLARYGTALTKFVVSCETPMAIALQGEWGSGKTSLMNIIAEQLIEYPLAKPIRFETWQHGAVGHDEALGFQLISSLLRKLADQKGSPAWQEKAVRLAGRLGKVLLRGAATYVAATTGGSIVEAMTAAGSEEETPDLEQLKNELSLFIDEFVRQLPGRGKGRVVLFVDDLDRVPPGRAIAMLEVLKNFLDLENCVFLVACDYEVVRQGVGERMGIEDPEKVDAFFHKIFQLSFSMPTQEYALQPQLQAYLLSHVEPGTGGSRQNMARDLASEIAPVVELATGTNPRAVKRFLNTLDLLDCLGSVSGVGSGARARETSGAIDWTSVDSVRTLLVVTALHAAWPQVGAYLARCAADEANLIDDLRAALHSLSVGFGSPTEDEDMLLTAVLATFYDRAGDGESWRLHPKVQTLSEFASAMVELLDTDRSGQLDDAEVIELGRTVRRLSLVSADTSSGGTGRAAFRQAVASRLKRNPSAAAILLGLSDYLAERCRRGGYRAIQVAYRDSEVAFAVKLADGLRRIVKLTTNGELHLFGRGDHEAVNEAVRQGADRIASLGIPWQDKGRGQVLGLSGLEWTAAQTDAVRDALGDLLQAVNSYGAE